MRVGLAMMACVMAVAPLCATGDETIVLEFPPARDYAAQRLNDTIAPPTTTRPEARGATQASRHMTTARSSSDEKVIGRLGVTSVTAMIHPTRSETGRTLARVGAGTYLALTAENATWYGVLMADRSTGWISRAAVRVLDYQVIGPNQPQRSGGGMINTALLNGSQRTVMQIAYGFLGVPYRWGGTSPNGMDCSAFVQRCFRSVGIELPRTAREQFLCGMPVSTDQLQTADRLYFANKSGTITHTGIYIGNGYFIHSSSSQKGVAINKLEEGMYTRMYAGARR